MKLDHGALLDSKRNELSSLKNELAKLDNDNRAHRAKQIVPVEDLRPQLERQLEQAKRDVLDLTAHIHLADETIRQMEKLVEACRAEWKEADGETFSGGTCPTCGQTLPPEQLNRQIDRVARMVESRKLTVFPIGIGPEADMGTLQRFSPGRSPLRLQGLKFSEFFSWLSKFSM